MLFFFSDDAMKFKQILVRSSLEQMGSGGEKGRKMAFFSRKEMALLTAQEEELGGIIKQDTFSSRER